MRSFTKKNPAFDDNVKMLVDNTATTINPIISALNDPLFTEAYNNLINLVDDTHIVSLINKDQHQIKRKFSALQNQSNVSGYHSNILKVKPATFNTEIKKILDKLSPNPDSIKNVLTAKGKFNNLDIHTKAPKVPLQTVENISQLLILKQLINAAKIRSSYIDAKYNDSISEELEGTTYGESKPHLVKVSGLYCAYCEARLNDGTAANVEHKIPKSVFPTVKHKWTNFVLACERCNVGFKVDWYVHPDGIRSQDKDGKKTISLLCRRNKNTIEAFKSRPVEANKILNAISAFLTNSVSPLRLSLLRHKANTKKPNSKEEVIRAFVLESIKTEVTNAFKNELKKTKDIRVFCSLWDTNNANGKKVKSKKLTKIVMKDFAQMAVYIASLQHAHDKIIWPDQHYTADGMKTGKRINSFQAYSYYLNKVGGAPVDIKLSEIGPNTQLQLEVFSWKDPNKKGKNKNNPNYRYKIHIKKLIRPLPNEENDVQFIIGTADFTKLTTYVNDPLKVKESANHMINLTGLNQQHEELPSQDLRIVRRTKAWLHAMKMLKLLTEFKIEKFEKLHNYYEKQLHPVNIKYDPAKSIIKELRNDTNSIALNDITGSFIISEPLSNGDVKKNLKVTCTITKGPTAKGIVVPGTLTGQINGPTGNQTFTGSFVVGSAGKALADRVILFNGAGLKPIANNKTEITINGNEGVVSDDSTIVKPNPDATIIKEWDDNRALLLTTINNTAEILKEFMWDNVVSMVQQGGFYSTWVHTFKNKSTDSAFAKNLIRKLDLKAKENPEDPHQFHGTDAEEIIASL